MPSAQAISATPAMTQLRRAWPVMAAARRPHRPWVAMSVSWSTRGRLGQKIHRPKHTKIAGSTTSMISAVHAMPMAHTGPSVAVDLRSATVRQSSPRITVIADAPIGGAAPFQAAIMASMRL